MTDFMSLKDIINTLNNFLEDTNTHSSLNNYLENTLAKEKLNTFTIDIIKKSCFLIGLKREWCKVSKNTKSFEERATLFEYNIIIKSLDFYHNS